MSMHLEGSAQRLTIFCGESDKAAHTHKPLHVEIVQRARQAGLAGATVLRGVEGFGASSVVHTTRFLSMSEDLPMVLVVVDTGERIQAFLPELDDLIEEGLVIIEDVTVLKYVGRSDDGR